MKASTEKSEKAEHVSGIVLQPLWRTQKIDWTVRKNVFEKSNTTYIISLTDDWTCKENYQTYNRKSYYSETNYMMPHDFKDRISKDVSRALQPSRYRQQQNRRRWCNDFIMSRQAASRPSID